MFPWIILAWSPTVLPENWRGSVIVNNIVCRLSLSTRRTAKEVLLRYVGGVIFSAQQPDGDANFPSQAQTNRNWTRCKPIITLRLRRLDNVALTMGIWFASMFSCNAFLHYTWTHLGGKSPVECQHHPHHPSLLYNLKYKPEHSSHWTSVTPGLHQTTTHLKSSDVVNWVVHLLL